LPLKLCPRRPLHYILMRAHLEERRKSTTGDDPLLVR